MIAAWPPVGVPGGEPPTILMCPTAGYRCVVNLPSGRVSLDHYPSQWTVGSRVMDYPQHQAMLMFAPTVGLLRAAQRAGVQGSFRRKVPGLVEALERAGLKVGDGS